MAKDVKAQTPADEESVPSETPDHDFSEIVVNVGGRSHTVQFPSEAATAAGVVACANGHPNIPDSEGHIICGCGSTEVQA